MRGTRIPTGWKSSIRIWFTGAERFSRRWFVPPSSECCICSCRSGNDPALMAVTPEQIVAATRSLGVRAGDLMIVHSSYKSLGGVEGGPAAVAQALVDAVSPGGSVFVPTFNYGN